MHNEEHLNLVLIMEYFGIICECDIQLTEPNANKKESNLEILYMLIRLNFFIIWLCAMKY